MATSGPPFRAGQVGSLLRPAPPKEARARREGGEITPGGLAAVEDGEIARVVRRQEEIGLRAVTDGEFRRSWWHFDFLRGLAGVESYQPDQGIEPSTRRRASPSSSSP